MFIVLHYICHILLCIWSLALLAGVFFNRNNCSPNIGDPTATGCSVNVSMAVQYGDQDLVAFLACCPSSR